MVSGQSRLKRICFMGSRRGDGRDRVAIDFGRDLVTFTGGE
jgi:hypothetical protein